MLLEENAFGQNPLMRLWHRRRYQTRIDSIHIDCNTKRAMIGYIILRWYCILDSDWSRFYTKENCFVKIVKRLTSVSFV